MCDYVFKEYLVYLEAHDTYPQRLRLRVLENQQLDSLLWQIERQLSASFSGTSACNADGSPTGLKFPLEATNCDLFVCDTRDGAMVPYSGASFDMLKSATRLLVLPAASVEPISPPPAVSVPKNERKTFHSQPVRDTVAFIAAKMTATLASAGSGSAADWAASLAAELDGVPDADDVALDAGVLDSIRSALRAPVA